jgi:hypothetical protein
MRLSSWFQGLSFPVVSGSVRFRFGSKGFYVGFGWYDFAVRWGCTNISVSFIDLVMSRGIVLSVSGDYPTPP